MTIPGCAHSKKPHRWHLYASKTNTTEVELSGITTDCLVVEHISNTKIGFSGTLFNAVKK